MKYWICSHIEKPLKNGEFCNRECELCCNCPNSRKIWIEGRVYYHCQVSGAFKTIRDRCDLKEASTP
jgi:hypothetical protein